MNQFEWQLGHEGKGNYYPDGSVHTWNINELSEPHHDEAAIPTGMSPAFRFYISPEGGLHDGGIGFTNGTGRPDNDVVREVAGKTPALWDGRGQVYDDFGITPRIEDGYGGYGHAESLIPRWNEQGTYAHAKLAKEEGWADFHTELKLPLSARRKIRKWVDRLKWPEGSSKDDTRRYHITILSMDEYDEDFAKWAKQQMRGKSFRFESTGMDIFADEHVVLRLKCPEWTAIVKEWTAKAKAEGLEPHVFDPPKAHVTIGKSPSGKWPQGIPDPHVKFETATFNINKNSSVQWATGDGICDHCGEVQIGKDTEDGEVTCSNCGEDVDIVSYPPNEHHHSASPDEEAYVPGAAPQPLTVIPHTWEETKYKGPPPYADKFNNEAWAQRRPFMYVPAQNAIHLGEPGMIHSDMYDLMGVPKSGHITGFHPGELGAGYAGENLSVFHYDDNPYINPAERPDGEKVLEALRNHTGGDIRRESERTSSVGHHGSWHVAETTPAEELLSWTQTLTPQEQSAPVSIHHTSPEQLYPQPQAPVVQTPHVDPPKQPYSPYNWADSGFEESPLNMTSAFGTHPCPQCEQQIEGQICPHCGYDPQHSQSDFERSENEWYDRAWSEPGNQPRPVPNQPMHWGPRDHATDVRFANASGQRTDQPGSDHTVGSVQEVAPQRNHNPSTDGDQQGTLVSESSRESSIFDVPSQQSDEIPGWASKGGWRLLN